MVLLGPIVHPCARWALPVALVALFVLPAGGQEESPLDPRILEFDHFLAGDLGFALFRTLKGKQGDADAILFMDEIGFLDGDRLNRVTMRLHCRQGNELEPLHYSFRTFEARSADPKEDPTPALVDPCTLFFEGPYDADRPLVAFVDSPTGEPMADEFFVRRDRFHVTVDAVFQEGERREFGRRPAHRYWGAAVRAFVLFELSECEITNAHCAPIRYSPRDVVEEVIDVDGVPTRCRKARLAGLTLWVHAGRPVRLQGPSAAGVLTACDMRTAEQTRMRLQNRVWESQKAAWRKKPD